MPGSIRSPQPVTILPTGSRPLKRVIQKEVQNPLATSLLKQSYPEGATLVVDFRDGRFQFRSADTPEPAEVG